jgi:hypothetical protein
MTTCTQRTLLEYYLIDRNMHMTEDEAKNFYFNKMLVRFAETLVKEGWITFTLDKVGHIWPIESEDTPSGNPNDYYLVLTANFEDK